MVLKLGGGLHKPTKPLMNLYSSTNTGNKLLNPDL